MHTVIHQVVPALPIGSPDPLENALEYVAGMMPFLLESGSEYACLIILEGGDATEKDMGEIPIPNPYAVHALALARELQGSSRRAASFVSIDPISRIETAAMRCRQGIWALSGTARSEALGILLYLLFTTKRIDRGAVCAVAEEYQDADRILEVFNTFCATMHSMAPRTASFDR